MKKKEIEIQASYISLFVTDHLVLCLWMGDTINWSFDHVTSLLIDPYDVNTGYRTFGFDLYFQNYVFRSSKQPRLSTGKRKSVQNVVPVPQISSKIARTMVSVWTTSQIQVPLEHLFRTKKNTVCYLYLHFHLHLRGRGIKKKNSSGW